MAGFWTTYWDVILVYGLAAILLYAFRSKFEFQGIIALLRTKLGLAFMKNTGEKYRKFLDILGYFSIFIGYLGMAFITGMLFYGIYQLLFVPLAPAVLSPVLPGVKIPGSPIQFPLWYTLIALFFAVIVHEASHGIYASVYKIKIKSSGLAFFGPLPGAFVEPDEKQTAKKPKREQLAVLAAGPFSNVVFGFLCLLLTIPVALLGHSLVTDTGVSYTSVQNNTSAWYAGLPPTGTITALDGAAVLDAQTLTKVLGERKIGDTMVATVSGIDYTLTLGPHPDKEGKAYMGITEAKTESVTKNPNLGWLRTVITIVVNVLVWTYIISLGIGIANLIPAGPLDGGRMFLLALQTRYDDKRARSIFFRWSWALLFIIILLVFVPILKAIF